MQIAKILALAATLALATAQASPVLTTSSASSAFAGATVVTFDAEANGTFTSRTFNGVTVSAEGGTLYLASDYSGMYASSGRYLTNISTATPITFAFDTAVSAFGFNWGAADTSWLMDVYDTQHTLLSTLNIAAQTQADNNYSGFIGADGAGALIGSVTMRTVNGANDYALIDNLTFAAAANDVPEPASLALVGIGLAGALLARRRQHEV